MSTTIHRLEKLSKLKDRISQRLSGKIQVLKGAKSKTDKLRRLLELRTRVSERLVFYSKEEDQHLLELIDHSIHELALS